MGAIEVLRGGTLTTVQDQGRKGYLQYGMPRAGAVDSYASRLANLLVANSTQAAVLEATLQGPELIFKEEAVIAVTGADMAPKLDGKQLPMWQAVEVSKGSVLSLGTAKSGLRSYIAVAGGIDVPLVMGSRATYLRGSLGGFKGRALQAGDRLKFLNSEGVDTSLLAKNIDKYQQSLFDYLEEQEIRVILGPQDDHFRAASLETFLSAEYKLDNRADRMGCRLTGPTLEHRQGADIISDGIPLGAIQVPGHGQPIIMLADRQTTGGYAKIATVISVDLPKVAQSKPGDKLEFRAVTVEQAQREFRAREEEIKEFSKL